jgi:hypothetical protein
MTYSKNGIAIVVIGLEFLLTSIGIEFDEGSVARFVEGVVMIASFLLLVWNQIDRKNVKNFIFKHEVPEPQ